MLGCPVLIYELVMVRTRINYGQDINISGLAGAVSFVGSDDGLWSVDGGNWQLAAGLINYSNVTLHLKEEVTSVSYVESQNYALSTKEGLQYHCAVTILATPLDEVNITFTLPVSIPSRRLQHAFTTSVRGFLNPKYLGLMRQKSQTSLVQLRLLVFHSTAFPFSRNMVKKDMVYKICSRKIIHGSLLDEIFSMRKEKVRIDCPAYPHFEAPEVYSPIMLDEKHLHYINSFENGASLFLHCKIWKFILHQLQVGPTDTIFKALDRCGKKLEENTRKAGNLACNVWQHLKIGPSITDAAMARLAHGTKVFAEGGNDKIFQQNFGVYAGEQLRKAFACYLSTSTGPVIGTLYLSSLRLAFCSNNPLCNYTPSGQQQWIYYKVVVQLDQLNGVNSSFNTKNPTEKYIQIVTSDNHEFWFMGFVSYDKALKHLRDALDLAHKKYNNQI